MVRILTTIEEITRCRAKTVFKTEEGYFVIYNTDDNICHMYNEIVENAGGRDYLLDVEFNPDSGRYSGWLMKKLEKLCPLNNALFYTYNELLLEHK
jgi:hypothetical protein